MTINSNATAHVGAPSIEWRLLTVVLDPLERVVQDSMRREEDLALGNVPKQTYQLNYVNLIINQLWHNNTTTMTQCSALTTTSDQRLPQSSPHKANV
ncbi:MAG: hypothetical protein GY768_29265 [Planctomycetaceae bacterium]|nr:hypothetical protein [Planctomycetaceae bacterium]